MHTTHQNRINMRTLGAAPCRGHTSTERLADPPASDAGRCRGCCRELFISPGIDCTDRSHTGPLGATASSQPTQKFMLIKKKMSVTLNFSKSSHSVKTVSEGSGEHPGQPVAEIASLMDRRQSSMGGFVGLTSLLALVKDHAWPCLWWIPALRD